MGETSDNNERHGVLEDLVVTVKDNFCTAGTRTTAASRMLQNYVPPYDATPVARLRDAGALCLGKTNMDEFGMGSFGASSFFGATFNALRGPGGEQLLPGGSSSGSAVAVQIGACDASLGSDTGGSVRMPASYCGVVGFKPSYGRTSRHGLIAYASSLDTPGVLARDVMTAARVVDCIAGFDGRDSTCRRDALGTAALQESAASGSKQAAASTLTVGVPDEYYTEELPPAVGTAWEEAARAMERAGCRVVRVSLPTTRAALSAYYVLATAEASSNLSRYDGARYGHRAQPAGTDASGFALEADDFHALYTASRSEGFGPEVQRRILVGTFALSASAHAEYYEQAVAVRDSVCRDFATAFGGGVDVLLTPATPTPALPASSVPEAAEMYLNDVMTVPANLAGLPAVSVPGLEIGGLPIGMQLIGGNGCDMTVVKAGAMLERLLR